jgi:hypothetical protein
MQAQMVIHSPELMNEQKELIVDLRTKVTVLERELMLVNRSTGQEISDL